MAKLNPTALKAKYKTGMVPTESDYSDFVDTTANANLIQGTGILITVDGGNNVTIATDGSVGGGISSVKNLNTTSSTTLSPSANEDITGTGSFFLHKVAKTGKLADLIGFSGAISDDQIQIFRTSKELTDNNPIGNFTLNGSATNINLGLATVAISGNASDLNGYSPADTVNDSALTITLGAYDWTDPDNAKHGVYITTTAGSMVATDFTANESTDKTYTLYIKEADTNFIEQNCLLKSCDKDLTDANGDFKKELTVLGETQDNSDPDIPQTLTYQDILERIANAPGNAERHTKVAYTNSYFDLADAPLDELGKGIYTVYRNESDKALPADELIYIDANEKNNLPLNFNLGEVALTNDYLDLDNKPVIGGGVIKITNTKPLPDTVVYGMFDVNQVADDDIAIPIPDIFTNDEYGLIMGTIEDGFITAYVDSDGETYGKLNGYTARLISTDLNGIPNDRELIGKSNGTTIGINDGTKDINLQVKIGDGDLSVRTTSTSNNKIATPAVLTTMNNDDDEVLVLHDVAMTGNYTDLIDEITITAGSGMDFADTLKGPVTINMRTPSTVTLSTTNSFTTVSGAVGTSHTHQLDISLLKIGDLYDVSTVSPSPTNNQALVYNTSGASGMWVNTTLSTSYLSDILISLPSNNQALVYNSVNNKWVNSNVVNRIVAGNNITVTPATGVGNVTISANSATSTILPVTILPLPPIGVTSITYVPTNNDVYLFMYGSSGDVFIPMTQKIEGRYFIIYTTGLGTVTLTTTDATDFMFKANFSTTFVLANNSTYMVVYTNMDALDWWMVTQLQ